MIDNGKDRLYGKYDIKKANGQPTDPKAEYFVLRLDTDPAARAAMLTYANEVETVEPEFAADIRRLVGECERKIELVARSGRAR